MKHIKHCILCLLLMLALAVSALAAPVPESLVIENLNGQQRIVKTYTLYPGKDPEELKEPDFTYDGYSYRWAYTTKDEHEFHESKDVVESVAIETDTDDLATILSELEPTMTYDDGHFHGQLVLDHTTLSTKAAGYANHSGTVTATRTIGPLDRNDLSYIPATTVKDGRTLSLSSVEWQVIATDLVGDVLAPASYQAVATYAASTSYRTATSYITTADYTGTVTASGLDNITYTVVYTGTELVKEEPEPPVPEQPVELPPPETGLSAVRFLKAFLPVLLLGALACAGIFWFQHRKNVFLYVPGEQPRDYELVAKYRVDPAHPEIDIRGLDPAPADLVAVEVKKALAKKLLGQEFTVRHQAGDHSYPIQHASGDWHEFHLAQETEECI